jgi:hypothetical protein
MYRGRKSSVEGYSRRQLQLPVAAAQVVPLGQATDVRVWCVERVGQGCAGRGECYVIIRGDPRAVHAMRRL